MMNCMQVQSSKFTDMSKAKIVVLYIFSVFIVYEVDREWLQLQNIQ